MLTYCDTMKYIFFLAMENGKFRITDNFSELKNEIKQPNSTFRTPVDIHTLSKKINEVMMKAKKNLRNPKNSDIKIIKPIWANCVYNERLSLVKNKTNLIYQSVSSKKGLLFLIQVLGKILKLKISNLNVTKREFYYQNLDILKSMNNLDAIIEFISSHLDVPPWELGILSTSKGMIAGSLIIKSQSGNVINFDNKGMLIPNDIAFRYNLTSSAKFVLIIEKYAAFQKLIGENFIEKHGPCILLTAKGYPDLNTRVLLKSIFDQLGLPIFALVDADPYGIEIMSVYRFGSLSYAHLSDALSVPSIKWIGIHPSDIVDLFPKAEPLSSLDLNKANQLLTRPFNIANKEILNQIKLLIQLGLKSEIEGMATISSSYLSDIYIPMKINSKKWI